MIEEFLEEYFEGVAVKVKPINHTLQKPAFYRVKDKFDLGEFDEAVRNMKGNYCLLLEMGSGEFAGWDSPRDDVRIGMHVLKKTSEKFEDINAAKSEAKEILIRAIALIRKDCEDIGMYADDQAGPLKALNTIFDSAGKYDDMSVEEGNWHGKTCYFDLKSPVEMSYDPDNYN